MGTKQPFARQRRACPDRQGCDHLICGGFIKPQGAFFAEASTPRPPSPSPTEAKRMHRSATLGSWLKGDPGPAHGLARIMALIGVCWLGCGLSLGCAGYRWGTSSLFRQDIRTIHVPIVRCDSFRPDLGVRLTEAIQKKIEDRTPYKLANLSNADSILACRLHYDTKKVITETATDEPRDLRLTMAAEVNWTDRIGNVLMQNRFLPPGETAFFFSEKADLVPEGGQSLATSQQRVIERMADHIVDQMEARW
jgi:hypothetical protein